MKNDKMARYGETKRKTGLSIWKSKKGGIPILSEIVAGVKGLIDWFFTSAPRPLQLLIFLFFILGLFSMVGTFLNVTGHYCDTAGNEYKTGTLDLITNFELLSKIPDAEYLDGNILPADEKVLGVFDKCVEEIYNPYHYENTGLFDAGDRVYLSTGTGKYYDGGFCSDCETQTLYDNITHSKGTYCVGDVYRSEDRDDFNFVQRGVCGKSGGLSACEPPSGYYYDFETANYVCISGDCADDTMGARWTQLLHDKGADLVPESPYGERDFRNAVAVECDIGDLDPKIRFFGIDVFDYRIWVFLLLLSALVWAVWKIKHP